MRGIGAFEAKNKLSTWLDWVEAGGEVPISRHDEPVARLVPAALSFDRAKAPQVARNPLQGSRGLALGGLKVKDLIGEGRP